MNYLEKIKETANWLHHKGAVTPQVGIVLGTGLGKMVDYIAIEKQFSYTDIPNFPEATVEFHAGKLHYGKIGPTTVIAMQGRFHHYEGYNMQQITFPIRVMHELGIKQLYLSNAAGGINLEYKKGDLVMLDDHINLQSENPLKGLNKPEYGTMFTDMSCPYNTEMNNKLLATASKHGVALKKGVYAAVSGPNLETRAEYHYLKIIGADMVGMSTVPEVIVANQIGLPCTAVSVITDECDPDNLKPVDISEIIAVAGKADEVLSKLFTAAIQT